VDAEEVGVWAPTALWTGGGVVGSGCSAGVGDQQSTCSVVAGEAETVVGVALFGWGEEVRRVLEGREDD